MRQDRALWQTSVLVASLAAVPACSVFFDSSLDSDLLEGRDTADDVGSTDTDVADLGDVAVPSDAGDGVTDGPADVSPADANPELDGAADADADTDAELPDVVDPGLACEQAACETQGRACVVVDGFAECGACLATGETSAGACAPRECTAARDCVSALESGEWSQCVGFTDACDDSGERVRERYLGTCEELICTWARRAEREPCLGEPTEGDPCATVDGIGLCVDNRCAVGPDVPLGVTATDGTSPESVTIAWRPVDGATVYRVFRDEAQIAEVAATEWIDTTADAGGPPEAPTNVVASEDRPYDIRVSWTLSVVPPGDTHTYTVRSLNADGISSPSVANTGYRAPWPVQYYERSADGDIWDYVGDIFFFSDPHGELPVLNPGGTIASDGVYRDRVTLTLVGVTSDPAPTRSYVVRAVNEAGTSPESAVAVGRRALSGLQYQWERSAGATPDGFTDIEFANRESEIDPNPPSDGSVRFYRCRITADPLEPVWTTPDSGFRGL